MKINEYIDRLNKLCSQEFRMWSIYQRAAQVLVGPWRDALAGEFRDHASDEARHADLAMRRIIALGGQVKVSDLNIPDWNSQQALLSGIKSLEESGIKNWQSLHDDLDDDDAFRHVIGGVLVDETSHIEEVNRWDNDSKQNVG